MLPMITAFHISEEILEYLTMCDWIAIEEIIEQIDLAEEKSIKINVNKIKRVIANPYYRAAIIWFGLVDPVRRCTPQSPHTLQSQTPGMGTHVVSKKRSRNRFPARRSLVRDMAAESVDTYRA